MAPFRIAIVSIFVAIAADFVFPLDRLILGHPERSIAVVFIGYFVVVFALSYGVIALWDWCRRL